MFRDESDERRELTDERELRCLPTKSSRTLLETELVGQVDEDVLDLLLGQRDVGLLRPGRLPVGGVLYISTAF